MLMNEFPALHYTRVVSGRELLPDEGLPLAAEINGVMVSAQYGTQATSYLTDIVLYNGITATRLCEL